MSAEADEYPHRLLTPRTEPARPGRVLVEEYECVRVQDPNHCRICQEPLMAFDTGDPELELCNVCHAIPPERRPSPTPSVGTHEED